MLPIQNELRRLAAYLEDADALKQVCDYYHLRAYHDTVLDVVSLNYDQFASDPSDPLVRDCRGLILENGSWTVVSYAFSRFANYGESWGQDFDWSNYRIFQKLDGTLINVYNYRGMWHFATRANPRACQLVDGTDITFRELAEEAVSMVMPVEEFLSKLDPAYCYMFELTAPENRIVVQYEVPELRMLGARNLLSFKELTYDELVAFCVGRGIPHVCEVGLGVSSGDEVAARAAELDPLKEEGFVLVDKDFRRLKVKSDEYCLLSKRRDFYEKSETACIELILSEHLDDVFPKLSPYAQSRVVTLKRSLMDLLLLISHIYGVFSKLTEQKEFALAVRNFPFSHVLFQMRKYGASSKDVLFSLRPEKILELLSDKNLLLESLESRLYELADYSWFVLPTADGFELVQQGFNGVHEYRASISSINDLNTYFGVI